MYLKILMYTKKEKDSIFEVLINNEWKFYCYLPYNRYCFGTVFDLWGWAKKLMKENPNTYRITKEI